MTRKGVWDLQEVRDKYLDANWVDDDLLFTFGKSNNGQLGHNDRTNRSSPTQVPGTTWNSTQPLHGSSNTHTMQLKTDGTAWVWGNNASGNLGLNNLIKLSSPTQLPGTNWSITNAHDKNFVTNNNIFSVKTDGTLWAWGSGYIGALGQNDVVGEYGANYSSPIQVGTDTTWNKTVTSRAIKTNGTLWAWGLNQYGQLGLNDSGTSPGPDAQRDATARSSPTQVGTNTTWAAVTGGSSMYAVKTDGTLWSWGLNEGGRLGQNQGGAWPSYGVPYSSPKQVGSGTDWKQDMRAITVAGESCAAMIKTDGTLYMVGRNNNGCLGQNDTVNRSSPVQVPGTTWSTIDVDYFQTVVATKTDGTGWGWGYSSSGPLGQNEGSVVRYSSPVQIPGTWSSISTAYNSTYGMKSSLG